MVIIRLYGTIIELSSSSNYYAIDIMCDETTAR